MNAAQIILLSVFFGVVIAIFVADHIRYKRDQEKINEKIAEGVCPDCTLRFTRGDLCMMDPCPIRNRGLL